MSMNAAILGTVNFLRDPTILGLGKEVCDEQPDGQPPPTAGQIYYAVCEGSWTNNRTEYLDEEYGVEITITKRSSHIPSDRVNIEIKRELRNKAAELRAKIHGSDLWMMAANTLLNEATENIFVEPLRFRSAEKIVPRGPDWFFSEGDNRPASGVSITLIFGQARRIQSIESQT
jgi:hypothetical protein